MIWFIVSPMGTGKTLTLTFLGYMFQLAGYRIYSNYAVNFPHVKIVDPENISHIKDGIFLGDELWAWLDSRLSSSRQNKLISSILLKSRKRGFDVLHTSQFRHQVDKRLREHTDFFIVPTFHKQEQACEVNIYRYYGQGTIDPTPASTFTFKAAPIFELYDSWEGTYEDDFEEPDFTHNILGGE